MIHLLFVKVPRPPSPPLILFDQSLINILWNLGPGTRCLMKLTQDMNFDLSFCSYEVRFSVWRSELVEKSQTTQNISSANIFMQEN